NRKIQIPNNKDDYEANRIDQENNIQREIRGRFGAPVDLMSRGGIQALKSFDIPAKCLVNQKKQVMMVVSNNTTNFGTLALPNGVVIVGTPRNVLINYDTGGQSVNIGIGGSKAGVHVYPFRA
ncbi:hypothetical protein HAX54_020086, partial [Datura stramonium]|nr:hypothetical protein [Datura stramonium]